jgi:plasmid maintenance system antidote protein VapI
VANTRDEVLVWLIRSKKTQHDWAKELGISPSHLSMVLSGERAASLGLADRMAKSSGFSIQVFVDLRAVEASEAAEGVPDPSAAM